MLDEVIGRVEEREAIDRFLSRAADGPAALILEGAAGIGKTILWDAARSAGVERGYRVLSARPAKAESEITLAGLGDLLADVTFGFPEWPSRPAARCT
jgi:hypothetical protein